MEYLGSDLEYTLYLVWRGAGVWRLVTESWSLYRETLALVIADTELVSDC